MNKRLVTILVLGASAAFGWFLSANYVEREAFKQENQTPEPTITFEVPSTTESIPQSQAPDTAQPAATTPTIPEEIPAEPERSVARESGGCYIGGCSSQLCSETVDMISTCEWRESYACFATATCARQASGACGWTETPELKQCLAKPSAPSEFQGELIQSM